MMVILFWIMFNGTVVIVSKNKFGKCLPVSMLGMAFIMYFTQFIFGTFKVGYVVLILVALAFIPLSVVSVKTNPSTFRNNMFSCGFAAFICALCIFGIIDYHRTFQCWDEWSHWGMFTKEMLRMDTWYSAEGTRCLVHLDYPPICSIFEMISCKFSMIGYNESVILFGLHMLSISLIVPPIVDSKEEHNIIIAILLNIIAIILINFISENNDGGFNTIYKDIILVLIFVYAMVSIYINTDINSKFNYWGIVIATAALPLTKQLGIAYVLLIWLYYVLSEMSGHKTVGLKYKIKNIAILVMVPLGAQYLWHRYIKNLGISGQFDLNKLSIGTFKDILFDVNAESVQRQTLNNFVKALINRRFNTTSNLQFTYVSAFIMVMILFVVAWKSWSSVWDKKNTLSLCITFICGTLGYAFTMGVLYLFCFSTSEMQRLASYDRYMSGYILGEILVFLSIAYIKSNNVYIWEMCILAMICAILTGKTTIVKAFRPGIFITKANPDCIEAAEYLESHIDGDKTVFVLADDTGKSQYYINYYADDIRLKLGNMNILEADFTDSNIAESVNNEILGADYLYIKDVNDNFNEIYSYLNNGNEFQAGDLYKISDYNGSKALTIIREIELKDGQVQVEENE